jgi:hypothetical protein
VGPEAKTTGGGEERETAGGAEVKHYSFIFIKKTYQHCKSLKIFD